MVAAELSVELYKYQILEVFWRFFVRTVARGHETWAQKKRQNPWVFFQFFMVADELSVELYKNQIL